MVNAPAAKAFQQNLVANHQISNVVVDQSCGYINGSSSVTPIGQMGSPLGEAINPEVKDLHEFVNDHLDNGNNLIPSFCSVESSIRYIGRNIDGDEVQKINVDEEDLFSDMIGFYKSAKLNQSAKLKVWLRNQPAVDTGGVLRHVFTKCFEYMVERGSLPPFFEGILWYACFICFMQFYFKVVV